MSRTTILRSLRPGGRAAVALTVAVLAMTVLPLLAPQLTLRFVDDAIAGGSTGHLTLLAAGYLGLALAAQVARTVTAWLANRLAWDGTNRLRERVAGHALSLDMGYHSRRTPGELIERVDGDVVAVADFAVAFLLDVVASVLLLAGVVVIVFTIDVRLGLALAAFCVLVFFGMTWTQRLAVPSATASRAAMATLTGNLEEQLAGVEDIRANGAGRHVLRTFQRISGAWYRAEFRGARIGSALLAGTSVAFAAGTALMLGLAAWLQASGRLTVGTAVLLLQYTLMVRTPFERLIEQMRHFQAALAGLARLGDLLAERPALPEPAAPQTLPPGPLSLRLAGVGFRYAPGDPPALADVTLDLAPGETLGVVGRTGSGKSTLARLVLRLYDPGTGTVEVGGRDLRTVGAAALRTRIGVVTQDVQLFDASVRENLTLFRTGGPGAEDARLLAVLAEVGLADWLAGRPEGLDSRLGAVSAGEAQLLAFARALLADPGLVVLDEPSSRLDPATERRVEDCIDRLLTGRTGILIAHRLSCLARVDKIAVLAGGRIVEYGYRADLAADPGSRFARMLDLAGAAR
ncbi:ABC transporter ATP-binding protein [Dactylosporangium sp. CA-139114]|uniref:ABC transporter ATP-binding protein n=1 Tax=Dactylosporangium sp. CA-139114 TaxID=3239931 RepID=UPI003D994E16